MTGGSVTGGSAAGDSVRGGPGAAVRAAISALPARPGVYRFRDAAGRAMYLGRAASLRSRVRSYWGDLGDRPHLAGMVAAIARIEAVECASGHEAAWLERTLLEAGLLPSNKTSGGQETEVYLRLDGSARTAGLAAVHEVRADRARYFGPYLGGLRVRQGAAGLLRVFPLDYAGDAAVAGATARELGRRRGADPAGRAGLAAGIAAVLQREPAAVAAARAALAGRRDAAAAGQAYELAGRIQAELAGLDWVSAPQRAAVLDEGDAVACGWSGGMLARFEIRGGRIRDWQAHPVPEADAAQLLARTPDRWREFAGQAAALAAELSHRALGAAAGS